MFTKIRDVAQFNRLEFLRSFGYDCLDKIKSIESKFNQVEWDLEKYSFEIIAAKVKTMIDSYQIISHQIYDSCQSADVDTLGHSIVKMFLQISSAIKWLIQSFSKSYSKQVTHVQVKKQSTHRENQSQKFRKREISRFILKGVKQKLDSQANQLYQSQYDDFNSFFGIEKQNYGLSKAKVHSINSSNLPMILEDTVDYFTKKGQYIQKFIALRQNYEGASRLDQMPTGQSIFDAEQLNRNNIATDKFRQMLNKYQILNTTKQVSKSDFGVQVAPVVLACQKIKKATEKHKIKQLNDDLQKQKNTIKALKIQLEVYEKKLSSSLKQNQQFQIIKKTAKIAASQFYNKRQSIQKQQNEISQSENETSNILKQNQYNQNDSDYGKVSQNKRYKRNSHAYKRKSIQIIRKSNSAQEIQKNTDDNQDYIKILAKYKIFPQAYSIMIQGNDRKLSIKLQPNVLNLDLTHRFSIFRNTNRDLHICSQLQQFQQAEKRFVSGKHTPFGFEHNSVNNSRISLADEHFGIEKSSPRNLIKQGDKIKTLVQNIPQNSRPTSIDSKQKRAIKLKVSSHNHHKRQSNVKLVKNFDTNCLLLKSKSDFTLKDDGENCKNRIDIQGIDFKLHFQTLYRFGQISQVEINSQTLIEFFVQENNAKNYEVLNLSQMCSFRKVTRPHRKTKASTQIKSFGCQQQQQYRFDNVAHNIIAKRIYNQLIKLKQKDKALYLRFVLFVRYPYSSVYRTMTSLYNKIDERQQISMDLTQIVACFKRIWALHHGCCTSTESHQISIPWCSHKQYILKFFGIFFNMNSQYSNENDNEIGQNKQNMVNS